MASLPPTAPPVRHDARHEAPPVHPSETCLLCPAPRLSGRGRYCSAACRQRAFRLRHTALPSLQEDLLRTALRRRATLTAHTVYECPVCETRLLGEQRCPDCNRFCRAAGLGGACPDCEQPVLLSELLEMEVEQR
jgi:hypothetical protein